MKMDKVAGSQNDEFYTPLYAVEPIFKYIKPNSRIWCPFDTEDSYYVKYAQTQGHRVVSTHISEGKDFFQMNPKPGSFDYIISNPPYSLKTEVFERLFQLDIPFAMLVGVVGLFESKKRFEMFRDNKFEIMYFDKRVSFLRAYTDEKPALNPPFSTVYLTHNMLPQQIVFEEIDKKNIHMQEGARQVIPFV